MHSFRVRLPYRSFVCLVIGLGLFFAQAMSVNAQQSTGSDWFSQNTPALTQVTQLPSNQPIKALPRGCTEITYRPAGFGQDMQDCVGSTSIGRISGYGRGIFTNVNTQLQLRYNDSQHGVFLPTPGSNRVMMFYPSSTTGDYIGLYDETDLQRSDLQEKFYWGVPVIHAYNVTKQPTYWLSDPSTNQRLRIYSGSRSFSENGEWLVVDSSIGMLRINTHDLTNVMAFAPSLRDSGVTSANMTISNDGQYAAVSQLGLSVGGLAGANLRLYDLATCTGVIVNGHATGATCASRNLWDGNLTNDHGISSQIHNPSTLENLTFVNDNNLTFDIKYNLSGHNFDAATYAVTAPGASIHGIGLLGMGDSYIAGEGTGIYAKNTDTHNNKCHQSLSSYPFLLGQKYFNSYDSVACSGAIVNDVSSTDGSYKGQVRDGTEARYRDKTKLLPFFLPGFIAQNEFSASYSPEVTLLSIGGNDFHFADIVKTCVSPLAIKFSSSAVTTCFPTYQDRYEIMTEIASNFTTLIKTYQDLKSDSLGGRLYVIGYPQVVNPNGNCGLNVHLDSDEAQFSVDLINYIDSVIESAALRAGVRYVDIRSALDGHRLCDAGDTGMNGLTNGNDNLVIANESYHPTVLGYKLMSEAIDRATDGLTQTMPPQSAATTPPIADDYPLVKNAPLGNQPRKTYEVKYTNSATSSVWNHPKSISVNLPGLFTDFASNSPVDVYVHSTPEYVGTINTDANGDLIDKSLQLPTDLEPGIHTLILQGKNMAGDEVEIKQVVYLTADGNDYDGDGIENSLDSCLYVTNSGQDADQDGIDDACDPVIGEAPVIQVTSEEDNAQKLSDDNRALKVTPVNDTTSQQLQTTSPSDLQPARQTSSGQPQVQGAATVNDIPDIMAQTTPKQPKRHSPWPWAGIALFVLLCLTGIRLIYVKSKRSLSEV